MPSHIFKIQIVSFSTLWKLMFFPKDKKNHMKEANAFRKK